MFSLPGFLILSGEECTFMGSLLLLHFFVIVDIIGHEDSYLLID